MCMCMCVAIAKSLTGALHFNTFGGNPMACAVGSAVVDVSLYIHTYLHASISGCS